MKPIDSLAFLGSKDFGLRVLRRIWMLRAESVSAVVTFDDRPDARSAFDGFVEFARETSVPLHVVNGAIGAEEVLRTLRADLCFVVCWYWLMRDELLDRFPSGAMGIHNSLLPKYRGGSPLVWAVINGEIETGFSVFSLSHGMDEGVVWMQEKVSIGPRDTIVDVQRNVENSLLDALDRSWNDLLAGRIVPRMQDDSQATYCAQRTPADGEIDWRWPAVRIRDFIRAQVPPYPGAFTFHNGRKLVMLDAEPFDRPYSGRPGQVARCATGGSIIVCGDQRALVVRNVLIDDRTCPAAEILSSIRIRLPG
jgi:methionyl-tRNA formyltransferase